MTNALARKLQRAMRRGDEAFIYHSGGEWLIARMAQLVGEAYPAGWQGDAEGTVVTLEAVGSLARPVTLAEMGDNGVFAGFELLRLPRLSVSPVPEAIWRAVFDLARRSPPWRSGTIRPCWSCMSSSLPSRRS